MVGVKPEAVSVVDETGALLGSSDEGTAQLSAHHKLEREMEERITSLLSASRGEGSVVTRVGLEIDHTEEDVVQKVFDPDGAVLGTERKRTQARTEGTQNQVVGATPRDPSNPADLGGGVTDTANANDEMRTWEISNTQTRTVRRGPRVKRMSIAILVDAPTEKPLSQEELKVLGVLAKNAVSFDAARGDSIEISSAPFFRPALADGDKQAEKRKIPWDAIGLIAGIGLLASLGAIGLLSIRRKQKKFEIEHQRMSLLMPGKTVAELEATLDQAILPSLDSGGGPDSVEGSYSVVTDDDQLLTRARQLLAQNPQRARIIIASWLSTEPQERGGRNVF
jgi:flagellar M-ring protein FliF